jgi:hypothetical protein
MTGRTDFITEACWEDVWTIWYVLVDDAYQALERHYGLTLLFRVKRTLRLEPPHQEAK